MRRSFNDSGFSGSDPFQSEEDADPRVGLVNLADVMLVFAAGLMLSLVSYWNMNLPNMTQLTKSSLSKTDEGVKKVEQGATQEGTGSFMEVGTAYQDPTTGEIYVLEGGGKDASGSGGASGSGEGSGSGSAGATDSASGESSSADSSASGDSASASSSAPTAESTAQAGGGD